MILKGNQRAGAVQLANHLLRGEENEHIELHEMRGFLSDRPETAFREMQAISHGTRCKQFMFSLSLSPPPKESVGIRAFEEAIQAVEEKLNLQNQPRIIVFHEKEGRRHAHCVWSRIDAQKMKAIPLPHTRLKLRDVSKELFVQNGWQMPKGFVDSKARDPFNFSLVEWQQGKRLGENPKTIKATFQECWATSDNRQAFATALEERGYYLAKGDRRSFVAVDFRGEVYSLSRWVGVKAIDLAARIGDGKDLPSVDETKALLASRMTKTLERHRQQVLEDARREASPLIRDRADMTARHKAERHKLKEFQETRWQQEEIARSRRMPHGLRGLWHRLTGNYQRMRTRNEEEAKACLTRDRDQKQGLIDRQLEERQVLQQRLVGLRQSHQGTVQQLREDIAHYMRLQPERPTMQSHFRDAANAVAIDRAPNKVRGLGHER